ncbi:MAG: NUDIX domain-containing protein [Candidatus Andersenbacteria bacterium]|nr:NUDIX domain-containing protein [Candidatus Andersenbacteria bacterium]
MKAQYDNIFVTAFIPWQGKALLVQRVAGEEFLPNYWEQVGGKVEPNESHEEAVIREVKEEAGITVKPLHSYHQFEYTHADGHLMCEIAYLCKLIEEPNVVLSPEHQKFMWVTAEELNRLEPITDVMRKVVRRGFKETNLQ